MCHESCVQNMALAIFCRRNCDNSGCFIILYLGAGFRFDDWFFFQATGFYVAVSKIHLGVCTAGRSVLPKGLDAIFCVYSFNFFQSFAKLSVTSVNGSPAASRCV